MVSYLYDEIGEREKSRFEAHVLNCSACADEISAFGGVRASVQAWRDKEFAPLATPVFELPRETEKPILSAENAAASRTWLAGWRELFSLSPAWAGAATACAALAICAGLFYVAFSSQPNADSVAEANRNASVAPGVPAPTVDDKTTATNDSGTKDAQPGDAPKLEVKKDKKQTPPKSVAPAEKVAAVDNPDVKPVRTNVVPKPAGKDKPATNVKKAPKPTDIEFMTREEEDKSLRLSDLFDEVSLMD